MNQIQNLGPDKLHNNKLCKPQQGNTALLLYQRNLILTRSGLRQDATTLSIITLSIGCHQRKVLLMLSSTPPLTGVTWQKRLH